MFLEHIRNYDAIKNHEGIQSRCPEPIGHGRRKVEPMPPWFLKFDIFILNF